MAEARAQNRYRVIERLESGGMAEVFRGESESIAGFKRGVAIKRVLPHLASNEKFIRMFLDEARLSAKLSHANVVQVFDIGHVENTYFIVMEFIDGVNLKAVVEFLRQRSQVVPVPLACWITMKVCEGLAYAHEATDHDGAPLNIVHRDVSPPNVLLSKKGEVKIVDFGLAKAAQSVEKTEPGIVKGKFSYLAPETAMGQEADPQADIFACGIMLWEMLAGRKLFLGESDYQTVKLVQAAEVPSIRAINPDVSPELERIIMRSLARDKRDRYTNAQALGEDLSGFLFSFKLKVSAFDVARLVKQVMEEKSASAKKNAQNDTSVIDRLIQEELLRFTSLGENSGEPLESGSQPLSPEALGIDGGARPLNPGEFVNMSGWAEDALGSDFDPQSMVGQSPAATSPVAAAWAEPGNSLRPSPAPGGSLADELEGEGAHDSYPGNRPNGSVPAPTTPSAPPRHSTMPPGLMQKAGYATLTAPPEDTKKFNGLLVAVVACLIVVGVGVGLYVTGMLPIAR